MATEDLAIKTATDAVKTGTKLMEATLKKAWSVLDAASEKKPPSEVLSKKAVKAVQGQGHG